MPPILTSKEAETDPSIRYFADTDELYIVVNQDSMSDFSDGLSVLAGIFGFITHEVVGGSYHLIDEIKVVIDMRVFLISF